MSKKIEVGDRVAYEKKFNVWVMGIVLEIDSTSYANVLKIRTADGSIENVSEHIVKRIHPGATYINLSMMDCECGLKYIREGGRHSDWCRLYNK